MSLATTLSAFPREFVFGVATSSYQIEGSQFGACGRSHWDDFAQQPGAVCDGTDGAVACDHYHRWPEDLDLIAEGGFDAYRFSFSWSRLLPHTPQQTNPLAIDFYERLIDGMLERGLQPFATLYHWDLPSRHAGVGGWQNRDTAHYFADYAAVVVQHFGDRLACIAPINEPWCVSWLSHYWGQHAPGIQDLEAAAKSMHYVQYAHGLAVQAVRSYANNPVGCVLNKEYAQPCDESAEAMRCATLFDGIYNRWFEESIFRGSYPDDVLEVVGDYLPRGYEADMATISQRLDWVGVNYYTRSVIRPDANEPHTGFVCTHGDLPKTDMGWEITPDGLSFFLRRLATDYAPGIPLYITENGMAWRDNLINGEVADGARIGYFRDHLDEIAGLIGEGIPIKGYFAWSLLDNYEWAFGYSKRFGLVYVDFATQQRIPKHSYLAWQDALRPR